MARDGRETLQWLGLIVTAILTLVLVILVMQPKEPAVNEEAAEARASVLAEAEAERQAAQRAVEEAERERLAQVNVPRQRPLRVAFLGDSLTYGKYVTRRPNAFTSRITSWLEQKAPEGVDSTVQAVPGYTSTQALENFDIPTDYDVVIVILGNNDQFREELRQYAKSYPKLVSRIHAESPSAQVLCVQPFLHPAMSEATDRVIEATCDDHQSETVVTGVAEVAANPELRAQMGDEFFDGVVTDGGHPNDSGHAAIANVIIGAFDLV